MIYSVRKYKAGMTLVELASASAIGVIIVAVVGMLLFVGNRNWTDAFNDANSGIRVSAVETGITFGVMGRKSNKSDYTLYERQGNIFARVLPSGLSPTEVVSGDAVEFRYWDVPLDDSLLDVTKTGTAYMLFYLEGDDLRVDRGPCPPGGVDSSGNRTTGAAVHTRVLARNVASLEFSHTTRNTQGDGRGCVRMDLRLVDPNDGSAVTVKTAALMRNVWP